MKWARIPGDLLAVISLAGRARRGGLRLSGLAGLPRDAPTPAAGVAEGGAGGCLTTGCWEPGFAYILVVQRSSSGCRRQPPRSARSPTPVVGVIGSMLMLGERPTTDGHDRLCADLCRRGVRADAAGAADGGTGAVRLASLAGARSIEKERRSHQGRGRDAAAHRRPRASRAATRASAGSSRAGRRRRTRAVSTGW